MPPVPSSPAEFHRRAAAQRRADLPRRAPALPPDERRAALIEATLPLVMARGTDVSTREIAEAAEVAEGTIFRVFPTKDDLIDAVVASAFDPTAVLEGLRAIDPGAALHDRLVAAVELLQQRVERISELLHAVGRRGRTATHGPGAPHERWAVQESMITDAIARLIEPDRDQLRCAPQEAARRLRLVSQALSHPRLAPGEELSPVEVVALFLDGTRVRPGPATPAASEPRLTMEVPSC